MLFKDSFMPIMTQNPIDDNRKYLSKTKSLFTAYSFSSPVQETMPRPIISAPE